MIAEILRRKNQKVSNSCREQLWHGQLAALWRDLVYAWRIWAEPAKSYCWQCAGDSFDPHRRQFITIRHSTRWRCDESRAIQHQCRTVFYPEWGAALYPKCGTKTNPRADPQNSDYSNDKNVIFASSCPSLETQLDDIATYQDVNLVSLALPDLHRLWAPVVSFPILFLPLIFRIWTSLSLTVWKQIVIAAYWHLFSLGHRL